MNKELEESIKIPDGWESEKYPNTVDTFRIDRSKQVQANAYKNEGQYPIVDQGQNLIAGWTDDENSLIKEDLPLIIFGDHTRIFKYIDFPFAVGADGTKLIKPKKYFNQRYYYYRLLHLDIPSKGYSRHYKILKEKEITYPLKPEQKKIAAVLYKIQKAIEVQETIIESTRELKKAIMQHLFTKGTRGEKTKRTEIGEIPESWGIVPFGEIIRDSQYGLSMKGHSTGKYPILRMNCQLDGRVLFNNLQYVNIDDSTFNKFRLLRNDLLFNRTNSHDLVGRMAVYQSDEKVVFASYLIRIQINEQLACADCINYYFNMNSTQSRLKGLASKGVSQSNINATKLKNFLIPLPKKPEQLRMVKMISVIDNKIDINESKKAYLKDLFKSMLYKLMTGDIKVKDLKIDVSEVEIKED